MDRDKQSKIDINQASLESLISLPGVGKGLAQRIVDGRPYRSLDELVQVKGLGAQSLAKLRPNIFAETEVDTPKVKPVVESAVHRISEGVASFSKRVGALEWMPAGRPPSSNQVLWVALITAGASILLSVIFSLAILAGINRTLNIDRHAAVREIRVSISQMASELGDVSADLASIDKRLQAVEGLSGRMSTVEAEFELVQEQISQAVSDVNELSSKVTGVSDEIARMKGKVDLFDAFLEGLQLMISELFPPVDAVPSQ